MYGTKDLTWTDNCLRYGRRIVATIVPEPEYPGVYRSPTWPKMYRVRLSNGRLSDTVNKSRAKDAAVCLVVADLNARQRRAEACHDDYFAEPVGVALAST